MTKEENKENFSQAQVEKENLIDTSAFDETLKEIDLIINTLEEKIENPLNRSEQLSVLPKIRSVVSKIKIAKKELVSEENNLLKNNNIISRIQNLEAKLDENPKEIGEHKINENNSLVSEINGFEENSEKKNKNSFGFFAYLILIIFIFFIFYGFLIYFKEIIILNFPSSETYIGQFFEIISIIKLTILNL